MDTIIRNARPGDFQYVLKLMSELGYETERPALTESVWNQILEGPKMGVLIALCNETLSGYLCYSYKPQLRIGGLVLEIDELCVSDFYRGAGIGTKLINEIKELSYLKKVKRIVLSTNRERESFKRGFYKKNGFQEKDSALLMCNL